ncbi:MAG: anhydro-N-acetylmuramic acid kinase [Pseudomonadota bacterium]
MTETKDEGPVWAAGVMTGTSMDGIDIAAIRTDGVDIFEFGETFAGDISDVRRELIGLAIRRVADIETPRLADRGQWPRWLHGVDAEVEVMLSDAIDAFLTRAGEAMRTPAENAASEDAPQNLVLGVHGQTIAHRPDEGFTLQIGLRGQPDAPRRSDLIEVDDFRSADMKAGGQGAPLAPFYHFALARKIGGAAPVAFLNIGGVANVTWVDPAKASPEEPGALLAFDTGPGNALINDWMRRHTGAEMDENGAAAAAGRVHTASLRSNIAGAYLNRRPPKSLDRNDFAPMLNAVEALSLEDGAATLTAFTADCVAAALRWAPHPPARWLICGGGRLNPSLMEMLASRLQTPVDPVEAVGLDGDMLEAQAFAYLAVRAARGLPLSAPGATGCRAPVTGGRVTRPPVPHS